VKARFSHKATKPKLGAQNFQSYYAQNEPWSFFNIFIFVLNSNGQPVRISAMSFLMRSQRPYMFKEKSFIQPLSIYIRTPPTLNSLGAPKTFCVLVPD
ncbi:unnamed protein product, partial [Larinioides sclopetarius]